MPLTNEEQGFIWALRQLHEVVRTQCVHCMQPAPCTVSRLLTIIERTQPTIRSVGDRVMAINYRGERLGKGRVVASQRDNGYYMKVRLDATGEEVVVPQAMSKRLVVKP